jgi:type IV pilus biogenesis protein CpaD/CtpE
MNHSGWLIITMLVAGCSAGAFDPTQRERTWMPAGDNDANLRAMVANPHDLVEGAGQGASAGAQAAPPVARVLAGKRYPLPPVNASTFGGSVQPQQQEGSANPGSAQ